MTEKRPKKKAAPKKTEARCKVEIFFEQIRAVRRAMTPAERIEALEFIMDEAIMLLGGIVRSGPENQQGSSAMWAHVRYSAETICKLEERAQLAKDRAQGIASGTAVAIYYRQPPPTDEAPGD